MSKIIDSQTKGGHIDPPPYCGAFPTRVNVVEAVNKYKLPLAMIQFVHERGARKYPEYSWIMNPNAPNASLEDNINALYRHFVAHSMGQIMDPEGLPHIFHMACRAGMLATKYYLQFNDYPPRWESLGSTYTFSDIGSNITPEEIMCLTIEQINDLVPEKMDLLEPYIMQLLVGMSLHMKDLKKRPQGRRVVSPLHTLSMNNVATSLFSAVMRYTKMTWEFGPDWNEMFKEMDQVTPYTPEDKIYLADTFNIKF